MAPSPSVSHSSVIIPSRSKNAVDLFVQSWTNEPPASESSSSDVLCIHYLLVHGYLEHSTRYAELAEYLCAHPPSPSACRVTVTTFDQRGHGKSGGPRAVVTDWAKETLTDLDTVIQHIVSSSSSSAKGQQQQNNKYFLLGHSNGGLQVLDYLLHGSELVPENQAVPWSGILISSPFLAPADELPWIKVMASKILGRFVPSLTIPTELAVQQLTNDVQKQQEHTDDELILNAISVGWGYQGLLAQARVKKNLTAKNGDDSTLFGSTPVFFAYSAVDQVADPNLNERVASKLESNSSRGQVTVVRRERAQHEIFNDEDRVELFEIVSNWVSKQV